MKRCKKGLYTQDKGVGEQKSVLVLFTVCKAVQLCIINSMCVGEELHLCLLSCEERVINNKSK